MKDASDKKILVDMLLWAVDNPAPANYLLISGDRDFSNALHQLRMRRYNILLAQPFQACSAPPPLTAAAKIVWLWTTLSSGGPPLFIEDSSTGNLVFSPSQQTQRLPNQNPLPLPLPPPPQPFQFKSKPKYTKKNNTLRNPNTNTHHPKPPTLSSTSNLPVQAAPESNNNNNNDSGPILEQEKEQDQPKTTKLFRNRIAPHEFFSACSNDPTKNPTNLQSHHHQDLSKSITSATPHNVLPISSACDAPNLSAVPNSIPDSVQSAPIVVHGETREDSKPTGSQNNPRRNLRHYSRGSEQSLPFSSSSSNVKGVLNFLPPPPEHLQMQGLIDAILLALNTLKVENVFPTETNITDCIRYGDPRYRTIDVRKALDCAIGQRKVVKQCYGALHLYIGINEKPWKCVNHIGGHPSDFPEATWTRVKQFLASSSGRSLMLASHCRYRMISFVNFVVFLSSLKFYQLLCCC